MQTTGRSLCGLRWAQVLGLLVGWTMGGTVGTAATDPYTWEAGSTAWRTSAGWEWPEPWLDALGAQVAAEAVAADIASWEGLRQEVSDHVQALTTGMFPAPLVGSRTWTAGAVTVEFNHAWDAAYWGMLPTGAVSAAGLSVNLWVHGRVARPTGWLAVEAGTVSTGTLTPRSWSGAGPANVNAYLSLPPGATLMSATRADGGPVTVVPTAAGATLQVPLAAGVATVLQVRWRRPTSAWRLVLGTADALSWQVRGPTGTAWLHSPATAVDATGSGRATLWATGQAGLALAVATADVPEMDFTDEVREVLLAASGPGGAPVAVLTATPASGRDPLSVSLRWLTAGATAVTLIDPAGMRTTVAPTGSLPAMVRYQWSGARDQPWPGFYQLEATGPGGSAAATAPVWVDPAPAVLTVDGPTGPVSMAEQKAGSGG